MAALIHFYWKSKVYTARVQKEQRYNSELWMAEVENGSMFILSKKRGRWFCMELGEKPASILGRAIEQARLA